MTQVLQLLQDYQLEHILIFVIILALAIKGFVDFFDWAKNRINQRINKTNCTNQEREHIKEQLAEVRRTQAEQSRQIEELAKSVNILIYSDKDDIKAWITQQHHFFCYQVGHIDDFSLDCIEKRYEHYKDEGGNSFVESLMNDLRSLKIVPSTLVVDKEQQEEENK